MKKFRLYWNTEKETEWLNQMAQEGWNATGFFLGVYTFEKCEPGKYQYQIDLKDKGLNLSENYRNFMLEVDVEVAFTWGIWVVLRRKTTDGDFQLFSDDESRLDHYKKLLAIYKGLTILEIVCMAVNLYPAIAFNNALNLFFAILIGTFVVIFVNMCMVTKAKIARIKESQGEAASSTNKNPQVLCTIGWLFLMCGNLVNRGDGLFYSIVAIFSAVAAAFLFAMAIKNVMKK